MSRYPVSDEARCDDVAERTGERCQKPWQHVVDGLRLCAQHHRNREHKVTKRWRRTPLPKSVEECADALGDEQRARQRRVLEGG